MMITSQWFKPGEDIQLPLSLRELSFQSEDCSINEGIKDFLDPYAYHIVLFLNDVPVAAGRILYFKQNTAKLDKICVLPKYRRQGIGDGLVKILDFKAACMGMQYSYIECSPELQSFFARIGYRISEDEAKNGKENQIAMVKETNDGSAENCSHQCACT